MLSIFISVTLLAMMFLFIKNSSSNNHCKNHLVTNVNHLTKVKKKKKEYVVPLEEINISSGARLWFKKKKKRYCAQIIEILFFLDTANFCDFPH
jgi:hypothetical protein